MRIFVVISVFLFVIESQSLAQIGYSNPLNSNINSGFGNQTNQKNKVIVQAGSSFGTNFNGTTVFETNISPTLLIPIKPKFEMAVGMSYQTYFINSTSTQSSVVENNAVKSNINLGTIYVSGIYKVNEKATIRGTAWKQFDLSAQKPSMNPRATNFESEGVNIGINYKFNDHFQVDASFDYSNGYNPYQMNSFGNHGMGMNSPFGY